MLKLTLERIHPYTISVLQDARYKGGLDPFTYYWCNKCTQCVLVNKRHDTLKAGQSGHPQRGCETSPLPTLIKSRLHRGFLVFYMVHNEYNKGVEIKAEYMYILKYQMKLSG